MNWKKKLAKALDWVFSLVFVAVILEAAYDEWFVDKDSESAILFLVVLVVIIIQQVIIHAQRRALKNIVELFSDVKVTNEDR